MYISSTALLKAIQYLSTRVHPFIGITFIACKHYGLSVGSQDHVSLDTLTREYMDEHHRIDRRSSYYFQPFKSANRWVTEKYPSGGLQTINTQTFSDVFIHQRGSKEWGFKNTYLDAMDKVLKEGNNATQVPADALAIWLYKGENIGSISDYESLVNLFFDKYHITEVERDKIFSARVMGTELSLDAAFSSEPLEMTAVLRELREPPDAEAEGGRTITSLRLSNAGPAPEMRLDFGSRLTVITGDNGLGKSFLLDFAWWAATGQWADREALPQQRDPKKLPEVEYTLTANSGRLSTFASRFDQRNSTWIRPRGAMTVEALAVFSRADGSFAVADPVRGKFNRSAATSGNLTSFQVWNGQPGVIEGLIRDWIRWQTAADQKTFDQFSQVLKRLSPEDLGILSPGDPIRLAGDPREIPTIQHRYATVPVTHASSGVQRVLLLAYLVIWSWQEHELASERLGQSPLRRMMVIVDELEAHLHPKWQRIVLPALMGVGDLLSSDLAIQMIAATHSPMILASMETIFDFSTDVLYHLFGAGPVVKLEETPFVKYGDASGWLTSPLFGLQHARSREAESAIETAKSLQLQDEPNPQDVAVVFDKLKLYLAGDDKFWQRWLYFAEQHGVKV